MAVGDTYTQVSSIIVTNLVDVVCESQNQFFNSLRIPKALNVVEAERKPSYKGMFTPLL